MPINDKATAAPADRLGQLVTSPYAAAAIAMFFWAGSMIAVRLVRGDVPPLGLSFWRTVVALIVVLPFAAGRLRDDWRVLRAHWPILALLGFLLNVGGNGSLFIGLQDTTAITASLINSAEPIAIVLVGVLLFRDHVSRLQIAGVAASLVGVLTLISRADVRAFAELEVNRGDMWILVAITSWAFYAVLLRRSPRGVSHLSVFAVLTAFGSLFLLPLHVMETAAGSPVRFDMTTVTVVSVLAVFSTLLGVILWNKAVAGLGSGRAALFIHLIPVYTVILGTTVLDEELRLYHGAGILLIGIGIWFASVRRETPEPDNE